MSTRGEQSIDIHSLQEQIQVESVQQFVQVDTYQQVLQIDPIHDRLDVDLVDERLDVDLVDDGLDVYSIDKSFDVDLVDERLDIDPPDHLIDVERADNARRDLVGHGLDDVSRPVDERVQQSMAFAPTSTALASGHDRLSPTVRRCRPQPRSPSRRRPPSGTRPGGPVA